MMITRDLWPQDWPEQLAAFVAARGAQGFQWGVNDCYLFTSDWIRMMAGHDPAAVFRGHYRSEIGAARQLIEKGARELLPTFELMMGHPREAMTRARRGDAVFAYSTSGPALGLVVDHRAAFLAPSGLTLLRLNQCAGTWRVG